MPIQPTDFLTAAIQLDRRGQIKHDEARLRTLVGRAYYACYLEIRRVGRRELGNPRFKPFHRSMCVTLKQHKDHDIAELGERLDQLRELRRIADYEPDKTVQRLEAQLILAHAVEVVNQVTKVAKGKFPRDIRSY